jgi:hypothetical protein
MNRSTDRKTNPDGSFEKHTDEQIRRLTNKQMKEMDEETNR